MWKNDGTFIQSETIQCQNPNAIEIIHSIGACVNDNGYLLASFLATSPIIFSNNVSANCPSGLSSAVFALYHNSEFSTPYVGVPEHDGPKPEVRLWPNPATERITIESEEQFPIVSVAVADMKGTILTLLPVNDVRCTLNVHNLAPGTYLAHVQTKAGISDVKFVVVRS